MKRQLKKIETELEEEKQKLNNREEHLKKLEQIWDFYQSDESQKLFNYPTLSELEKYENNNIKVYGNSPACTDKLEFDLQYIEHLLKNVGKYDFIVQCPLNKDPILPFELEYMQISEGYIKKLKQIRKKILEIHSPDHI